mmetsp:Transcript_60953/g.163181  ORF Transcript_60953/g.163181 Transcript_60953/m.163181 type:complete len:214 (+) Transcript_60953:187-828(+)
MPASLAVASSWVKTHISSCTRPAEVCWLAPPASSSFCFGLFASASMRKNLRSALLCTDSISLPTFSTYFLMSKVTCPIRSEDRVSTSFKVMSSVQESVGTRILGKTMRQLKTALPVVQWLWMSVSCSLGNLYSSPLYWLHSSFTATCTSLYMSAPEPSSNGTSEQVQITMRTSTCSSGGFRRSAAFSSEALMLSSISTHISMLPQFWPVMSGL